MSLERFSQTVSLIHAAAVDPAAWVEALRAMEDLTGSAGATLNLVPTGRHPGMVLAGRITAEQCAEYARDYMAICPRTAWLKHNAPVDYLVDAMVMTEAEMDRDPVYAWLAPQDLRYFIGSMLPAIPGYSPNISLQRSRRQGHVQGDELRMFLLLRHHVGQALSCSRTIGMLDAGARASRHLIDGLRQAVLLLDGLGRLLFANRAAERMLSAQTPFVTTGGALLPTRTADRPRFAQLLKDALSPTGHAGGWMRTAGAEGVMALFVAPLPGRHAEDLPGETAAMVVVHDPRMVASPSTTMLRELFGLTPTEARLAVLLTVGHDIAGAALTLGQAPATARIHLKSVFRKLGVSRQAEMTALLAGIGAAPTHAIAGDPAMPMSAGSPRE
ncbi:DNA-binding CsgD family transcriptional regulator/PAS domain-containing protein [Sphingomonas jejuensis]|uniref:DNA-binding CsgD family transcriptional regulator/PAS domain-containing protein n=1 Tax=Sphingomonas jejuensis TaxID=904715 RepID=A0ABX0XHT9_9SPHN|nr:PAS domain-containing protein [Sphingomonas jejuensis]NJC32723.1 DNA-binding CsgD family transcriptional regulator/PAS domain-containing protein [Sphingomonas jejuensis]